MHYLILVSLLSKICGTDVDEGSEKFRSVMTSYTSNFSSCQKDSDCTFFTRAGGFVINKSGLTHVNSCSWEVEKLLKPGCNLDVDVSMKKIGTRTLAEGIVPSGVVCRNRTCIGVFDSPPIQWFGRNSDYMTTYKVRPTLDLKCQEILKDLK